MSRLKALRLEITNRCPLVCSHCSVVAGPHNKKMMPVDAGLRLIGAFALQGGRRLIVTGGEPLTHPGCPEFLREAKNRGLHTTLFTMGICDNRLPVHDGLIVKLTDAVDVWTFSIHASDAAKHDELTNSPGSFDLTLRTVAALTSAGAEVSATFFVHPRNVGELIPVSRLCGELGLKELRVLTSVPQGRASSNPDRFVVPEEALINAVEEAAANCGVRIRLGEAAKARHGQDSNCRAIEEELLVNWDGWLSPCHAVEPTPSAADTDNVFRVQLDQALARSPRLARSRELLKARGGTGCTGGCLARLAILGAD